MGSFFGGLLRGIVVTFLGTAAVYVIFFAMMAPLPKDAGGIKSYVSDLMNFQTTLTRFQNKSTAHLDSAKMRAELDGEMIPADAKIIEGADKISAEEIKLLKLENAELKKEVERLKAAFTAIPKTVSIPQEQSVPTIELRN